MINRLKEPAKHSFNASETVKLMRLIDRQCFWCNEHIIYMLGIYFRNKLINIFFPKTCIMHIISQVSATMVAASTTVGTPMAITLVPRFCWLMAFRLFPTGTGTNTGIC